MTAKKILIVEDNPALLRGLKDNFQAQGYQVRTANDGEKGLDWTRIRRRLSPDPRGGLLSTTPATRVGRGTSFSPPPFDLQLQTGPGWLWTRTLPWCAVTMNFTMLNPRPQPPPLRDRRWSTW